MTLDIFLSGISFEEVGTQLPIQLAKFVDVEYFQDIRRPSLLILNTVVNS
jgi:hypothetical protein